MQETEEHRARSGPSTGMYQRHVLPTPSDPGWTVHRHRDTSDDVHMINIHGPFHVITDGRVAYCESGWLAINSEGEPYAISDADHDVGFEPVSKED